jgi:hypothetical protein
MKPITAEPGLLKEQKAKWKTKLKLKLKQAALSCPDPEM